MSWLFLAISRPSFKRPQIYKNATKAPELHPEITLGFMPDFKIDIKALKRAINFIAPPDKFINVLGVFGGVGT